MPEGDQQHESLGWRAGLPDNLKGHESIVPFKTVGDFANSYLEVGQKLKDAEGKLGNSIPKLSQNATQEERDRFFNSLGRPEKAEGYQFGKEAETEKILLPWKQNFHKHGLTSTQAAGLMRDWDGMVDKLVTDMKANTDREIAETSAKLKTELGDKYDASMVLVSRLWKEWGKSEVDFDKAFQSETSVNRVAMIRFILNVAAKTGEDASLRGASQRQVPANSDSRGYDFTAFNLPAARV